MKKINSIAFGIVVTILCMLLTASCDTDETQRVATLNNLILEDEFLVDGAPDPEIWDYDLGDGTEAGIPGWGNNELQYYTDRPENVRVEDGMLVITAREEAFEGANFTSARLVSRNKFEQQYGRFEARMKLPYGKGYWPAFWLLGNDCDVNPWPACGEIDIMEYLGDDPVTVFGSVHGPGFSGGESVSKKYSLSNNRFDSEFHVFGMEWTPNRISWYVDGDLYASITREDLDEETDGQGEWVFDRPFYIIINVAIGGDLPGSPNNQTAFPQDMLVDYVRVYN